MDFGGEDTNLLIDDQSELGMKTEIDGEGQEMSVDQRTGDDSTVHDNPEQMLQDLQNPMSVAASDAYSQPPATPFSAPPTPYQPEESTVDDEPDSPPTRPPRPDTANSMLDRKPDGIVI